MDGEEGIMPGRLQKTIRVALASLFVAALVFVYVPVPVSAQVPDPCNYVPSASMLGDVRSAFAVGGAGVAATIETVGLTGVVGTGSTAGVLGAGSAAVATGFALGPAAAAATVFAAAIGTCAFVDWLTDSPETIVSPTPPPRSSSSVGWPFLPQWCNVQLGDLASDYSILTNGSARFNGNSTSGSSSDAYRAGLTIGGQYCSVGGDVGSTIEATISPKPDQGGQTQLYSYGHFTMLGNGGYTNGQSTGPRLASMYSGNQWAGLAGQSGDTVVGGPCGGPGCNGALTTTYVRTSTGFTATFCSASGCWSHEPPNSALYVLPTSVGDFRDLVSGGYRSGAVAQFFAFNSVMTVKPTGFISTAPEIAAPFLSGETDCADSSGSVATRSVTNVGDPNGLRLPVAGCLTGELPVAVRQTVRPTGGVGPAKTVVAWQAPSSWIAPGTRPVYAPCLVKGNTCGVPSSASGSCVWGGIAVSAAVCSPQTAGGRSSAPAYPSGTTAVSRGLATATAPYPLTSYSTGSGTTPTTVPGSTTNNVTVNFPEAVKIDPGDAPAAQAGGEPCRPSGWGRFNPVSWVSEPAKCAIKWAFVPSSGDLDAALADIKSVGNQPPFQWLTGGVAMVKNSSLTFCRWADCAPAEYSMMSTTIYPRTWDSREFPAWVGFAVLIGLYLLLVMALIDFL